MRDFPTLDVVLAHGGRGWWYDAAAFMALSNPTRVDRAVRAAARSGCRSTTRASTSAGSPADGSSRTDWPGVPAPPQNARAVVGLGLDDERAAAVLGGNALRVYAGLRPARRPMTEIPDRPPAPPSCPTRSSRRQGKQLHDTRNWVFLHGTAAQFETHTPADARARAGVPPAVPEAHLAGHRGAPDGAGRVPVDDPVVALLQRGRRGAGRPDAQARGAPGRPARRAGARRARAALHGRAEAARHREAGPGDHRAPAAPGSPRRARGAEHDPHDCRHHVHPARAPRRDRHRRGPRHRRRDRRAARRRRDGRRLPRHRRGRRARRPPTGWPPRACGAAAFAADVSDEDAVERVVGEVVETAGRAARCW